jgi:hypothetical protein
MTFWNSLSTTFVSALRYPRLWILQFLGNAIIITVFILWLHIPDAYWWQLFFQAVIALALIVGLLVLHGGTMNYFTQVDGQNTAKFGTPFKQALKHLPAFVIFVAVFYVVLHFVDKLDDYQYEFPGYLRSEFPSWLRNHISEERMDNLYLGFIGLLRWVIVPGLFLPFGLMCAEFGFRAFTSLGAWRRTVSRFAYWVVFILAAFIGVYFTGKILNWLLNPLSATLGEEKTWLAVRMLVAYLLALFSWLWVCAMLAHSGRQPDPPAAAQKVAA